MDSNKNKKYDYSNLDKKVESIVKKAISYMKGTSEDELRTAVFKAYEYARHHHEGDFRKSGEPYIYHPIEATIILLDIKPDIESIQACILHDVIEDTPVTYEDILAEFGPQVALLCECLVKVSNVKYKGGHSSVDTLRKMFVSMADDIRVIFIKFADRIHNMQTISHHPNQEKREKIARETVDIYAPIAERLGLYHFKDILEEECFKVLNPDEFKKINSELKKIGKMEYKFRESVKGEIDSILKDTGINYTVEFRVKSAYSIYKKTKLKGIEDILGIYDLFGVRIITDSISDCYGVLGYIHNRWKPIPKRIKDYIALSKSNGYQSLHTTITGFVKDFRKQPTEIQIRTEDMNKVAEFGIAAHYRYKEKGSKNTNDEIDWVEELRKTSNELENDDLMHTLKIDVFKNRISVFTPNGDVLNLPQGSTPIDFAYSVHEDIGNHAHFAKVNGKTVPINSELSNGDTVEIIVNKDKTPNPMWISFVKTAKARNKIKSFLSSNDTVSNFERGVEVFNRYLEKLGYDNLDKNLSLLNNIDGKKLDLTEKKHLIEQIGSFSQSPSLIFKKIIKDSLNKSLNGISEKTTEIKKDNLLNKVIIGGESDIPYTFGKCCNPVKGDKVVAYVTSKGSITIHKRDCFSVKNSYSSDRLMPSSWEGQKDPFIQVGITFFIKNQYGTLKSICDILFDMKVNIMEIHSSKGPSIFQRVDLTIELLDSDYLMVDTFIDRVKNLMGDSFKQSIITKIEED